MKKIITLILAAVMLFALCACNSEDTPKRTGAKIKWSSSMDDCARKMKNKYKITDDDIDYDPPYLCEFNFFDDVKFENFDEAELEFFFDESGTLCGVRVNVEDDPSTILKFVEKYLGEAKVGEAYARNSNAYYWNDGKTGAVFIEGGYGVEFANLSTDIGRETFERSMSDIITEE